jgi:hypothetical protein
VNTSQGCGGSDDIQRITYGLVSSVLSPCQAQSTRGKNWISIVIDFFGIWNLLATAVEFVEVQLTKAGGEV